MKDSIHMEPLSSLKYDTYIKVGTKAYNQHYFHLWENRDSTPYIESSFTHEVLEDEEVDTNTLLFLINYNDQAVGVLKFTINCRLDGFTEKEALYIDKIYILKEHSGMGIGKKVLEFVILRAQEYEKKIVWLDTMQNGPALNFYIKNKFEIHSEKMLEFSQAVDQERPMYIMTRII